MRLLTGQWLGNGDLELGRSSVWKYPLADDTFFAIFFALRSCLQPLQMLANNFCVPMIGLSKHAHSRSSKSVFTFTNIPSPDGQSSRYRLVALQLNRDRRDFLHILRGSVVSSVFKPSTPEFHKWRQQTCNLSATWNQQPSKEIETNEVCMCTVLLSFSCLGRGFEG